MKHGYNYKMKNNGVLKKIKKQQHIQLQPMHKILMMLKIYLMEYPMEKDQLISSKFKNTYHQKFLKKESSYILVNIKDKTLIWKILLTV